MSRIEAIFFDLDGTLTGPKVGITRCIRHALRALGVTPPDADDLTWCIGPPLLESFKSMLGDDALAAGARLLVSRPRELVDILDAWRIARRP